MVGSLESIFRSDFWIIANFLNNQDADVEWVSKGPQHVLALKSYVLAGIVHSWLYADINSERETVLSREFWSECTNFYFHMCFFTVYTQIVPLDGDCACYSPPRAERAFDTCAHVEIGTDQTALYISITNLVFSYYTFRVQTVICSQFSFECVFLCLVFIAHRQMVYVLTEAYCERSIKRVSYIIFIPRKTAKHTEPVTSIYTQCRVVGHIRCRNPISSGTVVGKHCRKWPAAIDVGGGGQITEISTDTHIKSFGRGRRSELEITRLIFMPLRASVHMHLWTPGLYGCCWNLRFYAGRCLTFSRDLLERKDFISFG